MNRLTVASHNKYQVYQQFFTRYLKCIFVILITHNFTANVLVNSVFFVSISFVECKTVSEESPDTYHGAETQKHNQKLEHSEYFPIEIENSN